MLLFFFTFTSSSHAHYDDFFRTSSCVLWTRAKCVCAKVNKSRLLLPLLALQWCVLSLANIQKTRRTLILSCVVVEVIRLFAIKKKNAQHTFYIHIQFIRTDLLCIYILCQMSIIVFFSSFFLPPAAAQRKGFVFLLDHIFYTCVFTAGLCSNNEHSTLRQVFSVMVSD